MHVGTLRARYAPPENHQPHPLRKTVALAAALVLTLAVALPVALASPASAATVGAGSYGEGTPPGGAVPTQCNNQPITNPRQHVTSNFPAGAIPTNDWWTSLLWRKFDCAAVSQNLFAHPFALRAETRGLGVGYPTTPTISGSATGVGEYHFPYAEDFNIGVQGLNVEGKVDGYTDWTVSELWTDGARSLRTTFGHGLPFIYATASGAPATLTTSGTPRVWHNQGSNIGFTVGGHDYVAFAPSGASWSVSGSTISSNLASKGYFSVAVLPTKATSSDAERVAALNTFAPYAHRHVTGTQVSWSYNEATARMTATYSFTTTAKEGSGSGTIVALYPHQRDQLSGSTPSAYTYVSPRGPMSVLVGVSQFTTVATFNGVLPQLAGTAFEPGSADMQQLSGYIAEAAAGDPFAGFGNDTYWTGKAFGRATQVVHIADQVGNTTARDHLVGAMKTRLSDWLTVSPGETERGFWYNPQWGTLIGYPASYGSDTDLNDHHFHYGYYVVAAATVAQYDPAWAQPNAYGGMINMVIKDAANWDRSDTRFPFLRDFDIYAGHDWASGHAGFGSGNNQESSSEGMNFASGLIQWGQATGNTSVRDLGIYLYTTQASAIENYWFDTDDEAFPAAFDHSTVGMVWGSGGAYATWFTDAPEMIQGINLLPNTAGHLYLGYNPGYIQRNLAEIQRNRGGAPTVWKDILWEFQALADAPAALAQFRAQANSYAIEEGESRAHTFYWLKSLEQVGQVDRSVTANTPLYAVFIKNGIRTHQAANQTGSPLTVRFSDGVQLVVPARSIASTAGPAGPGGDDDGGGDDGGGDDGNTGHRDATSRIEAESFDGAAGVETEATTDEGGGLNVGWIANGDHLRFDGVDFGSTPKDTFEARIASGAPAGVSGLVQVRLDSQTAPVIGSLTVSSTGGWQSWTSASAAITPTTGVHVVYLTFQSGQSLDYVNVNWLTFSRSGGNDGGGGDDGGGNDGGGGDDGNSGYRDATSRIEAESFDGAFGVGVENTSDVGGGQNVGWIGNGDHLRYDGVDFGTTPKHTFSARVASGAPGGVSGLVQVRLDSPNGPVVGSFAIADTGGWQSWRTVPGAMAPTTGVHTVYLTFASGQPLDYVNLNWVTFS